MGLDITAYKCLRKIENPKFDEFEDLECEYQWCPGVSMEWSESIWKGRGYPIEVDAVYEWQETFSFCAGSYSGYNRWRRQLSEFKGGQAFQELIEFADNEGVIGSQSSMKLKDDFNKYYAEAIEYSRKLGLDGNWFLEEYKNWSMAFELASQNGAVDFH